ncbi:MAG: AbrB/MazE/SpoVT family DNA-binding domain-containing protein [Neorhizobium sp.]|nr:AbrB/MazE/SpoVT family DNA-binding domain-containing protein [Neorhizobium sp.]
MARVIMSKDGAVVLPQSVRDAHGLTDGAEFEVIDGGREIRLEVVKEEEADDRHKRSAEKFLSWLGTLPRYDGPSYTDADMHEAIDQAAIADWERLERQWSGETDDRDKDD